MPSTNDRVTLFLNATNTTVAVLSLAFIVWLQLSTPDVPADDTLAVCLGPASKQEVDFNFAEVPLLRTGQPQ